MAHQTVAVKDIAAGCLSASLVCDTSIVSCGGGGGEIYFSEVYEVYFLALPIPSSKACFLTVYDVCLPFEIDSKNREFEGREGGGREEKAGQGGGDSFYLYFLDFDSLI